MRKTLVETIRIRRQVKGLSQAQLGKALSMPQSHLARIESGATDVRLSIFIEIARTLDLEPMLIPKYIVPAVEYVIDPRQSSRVRRLVGNERKIWKKNRAASTRLEQFSKYCRDS